MSVLSELWRALWINGEGVAWTVSQLREICNQLSFKAVVDELSTSAIRDFIQEHSYYFDYSSEEDTVSLPENFNTAIERCLVEFVGLQVQAHGSLDLDHDDFEDFFDSLPGIMIDHAEFIYDGSLQLFVETHPTSFSYVDDSTVELGEEFEDMSILQDEGNLKTVSFFRGLLQKIGATEDGPCPVHTLTKYLDYMEVHTKEFLLSKYFGNLNMFFLINCRHFNTTSPERGSVYLTDSSADDYIVAAYLKEQLRKEDALTHSTGLTLKELLLKGVDSYLAKVRFFFSSGGLEPLRRLLKAYRNLFRWQKQTGRVCLRDSYCSWQDEWDQDKFSALPFFVDLLKDIGATSPSNPICFNYVLQSVQSAPARCRSYLEDALAGLDVIDLFHLSPWAFDLSTVNCVSLKTSSAENGLKEEESDGWLSVCYAGRLLKYVPDLTPDLLKMCTETAPPRIRDYCKASIRGRLRCVIDRALDLEL